jgi:hypothetical protein
VGNLSRNKVLLVVRDITSLGSAARRLFMAASGSAACALFVLASGCSAEIKGTAATGGGNATGATGSGGTGAGTGAGGSTPGSGGSGQGGSAQGGSASGSGTSGTSGGTTSSGGSGGGGAPPVGGELSSCSTPGPRLIRRLTSIQYLNTLVDAFGGDQSLPTADVLTDPTVMKFRVDADAAVIRDLDAGLLMNYAETVAAWAVPSRLSSALNVTCTTNDATCRASLINTLGLKLFREPLSSDLVKQYDALGAAETTFNDAAASIVTTMIESPYLLYRRELGPTDDSNPAPYKLTAYEVASELAYFMTDSAPDPTLLAAAKDGSLLQPGGIDTQSARLAFTQGMKDTVSRFAASWFELDGLATKAKDDTVAQSDGIASFNDAMRASMVGETQEFFADLFANNGTVTDLLTSKATFIDENLGAFYGVSGAPMTGFAKVDISNTMRAPGMLGQAAFLTQHAQPENSSPVQRGRFVRDRLLCEQIPPMPSNLNTNLASGASFKTNRQRYEQHDKSSACAGCHVLFDPVGFTFENFDGFGRYRDTENGVSIDASGYITPSTDDVTDKTPLNGAQSLIDYLASNDQFNACVVRYWSYYAHGRDNWTDKKCNDDAIRREASSNHYELFSIFSAILHAPNFTTRVKDM